MCNAWNHPAGCNCGWGGIWYGRTSSEPERLRATLSSFVNPHARCPVCGCPVFYYQSPDGGRVFFDELGPPWPKHGCTSNGKRTAVSASVPPEQTEYQWQRAGWRPLLVEHVVSYSPLLVRIVGTRNGEQVEFYLRKRALSTGRDPREFLELSAVHCRPVGSGKVELAILGPSLCPIETIGFASSMQAASPLSSPKRYASKKSRPSRRGT